MTSSHLLIGILIISVIFWTFLLKRRKRNRFKTKDTYVHGLHMLLDGKYNEALEKLKKTVKMDTENIMAYITLGDIFRKKGFPIRAAKIHRNLLVRGDISNSEINTVLHHLVLDYRVSNMLDKAIEMADRLVQRNKKNVENQKLLLSLYEEKGDWDKAFFYRQSINKWLKKRDQTILALYKVQSGLQFIQNGAEREGRIRFREAIKFDKKCIPAYLHWGESYRREGRNEDAFNVWREFTQNNTDWAHLAFKPLKDVLFDLGRYSEIHEIYQQVIHKKPRNPYVYINLAELYKKQGKLDQAINLCRKVLENHPYAPRARYVLAHTLKQKGEESAALEDALIGLSREAEKKSSYSCSHCGYKSDDPLWHCPDCLQWNTFLK